MTDVDRRAFTVGAAAVCAALAAGMPAAPAETRGIVIADERHANSRAFARDAAKSGARIVWTQGDVTDFWHNELDLLWRREKVALSGLTERPAFFYLVRLGMDRGLRVISKSEEGRLIRWTIAARPRASIA